MELSAERDHQDNSQVLPWSLLGHGHEGLKGTERQVETCLRPSGSYCGE